MLAVWPSVVSLLREAIAEHRWPSDDPRPKAVLAFGMAASGEANAPASETSSFSPKELWTLFHGLLLTRPGAAALATLATAAPSPVRSALATVLLASLDRVGPAHDSAVHDACLAVRRLVELGQLGQFDGLIAVDSLGTAAPALLAKLKSMPAGDSNRPRVMALERISAYALATRRPTKRTRKVETTPGYGPSRTSLGTSREEAVDPKVASAAQIAGAAMLERTGVVYQRAARAAGQDGGAIPKPHVNAPERLHLMAQRAQLDAMRVKTQRLVLDASVCQSHEIVTVFQTAANQLPPELQAAISLSVWAGRPIGSTQTLPIVSPPALSVPNLDSATLALNLKPLGLWLKTPNLPKAAAPRPGTEASHESSSGWSFLPLHDDLPGVGVLAGVVAQTSGGSLSWGAADLERIKSMLREAGVTPARLASFTHDLLARGSGDHALADIALGRAVQGGKAGRLYYSNFRLLSIASEYVYLTREAFGLPILRTVTADLAPQLGPLRTGSRVVPTLPAARHAFRDIQAELGHWPQGRASLPRVALLSARHAAYTLLLLHWSTGARPYLDVINSLSQATDWVVLTEKEGGRGGTRTIKLPRVASQQLLNWDRFRSALIERFHLPSNLPRFCILGPDGSVREATFADVSKQFGGSYPFLDNGHRHFLRTHLRDPYIVRLQGELLDAVLSHGGFGQEPHARQSGLAPRLISQWWVHAVNAVFDEVGIEAAGWTK